MNSVINTPQPLDLDDFEDIGSATVVIKNPANGAPTTSTIDLVGPEHPIRKKLFMDRARKQRSEFQRTGKIQVTDPLEDVDSDTDYIVASTIGWDMQQAGKPLPFNEANARALYTDPKRQWLRAQVKKALDEAERFISSSAKT